MGAAEKRPTSMYPPGRQCSSWQLVAATTTLIQLLSHRCRWDELFSGLFSRKTRVFELTAACTRPASTVTADSAPTSLSLISPSAADWRSTGGGVVSGSSATV